VLSEDAENAVNAEILRQVCARTNNLKRLCIALFCVAFLSLLESVAVTLGGSSYFSAPLENFCRNLLANESALAAAAATVATQ
jgi:hypothetical protein